MENELNSLIKTSIESAAATRDELPPMWLAASLLVAIGKQPGINAQSLRSDFIMALDSIDSNAVLSRQLHAAMRFVEASARAD